MITASIRCKTERGVGRRVTNKGAPHPRQHEDDDNDDDDDDDEEEEEDDNDDEEEDDEDETKECDFISVPAGWIS